jgi:hypothetical protein
MQDSAFDLATCRAAGEALSAIKTYLSELADFLVDTSHGLEPVWTGIRDSMTRPCQVTKIKTRGGYLETYQLIPD